MKKLFIKIHGFILVEVSIALIVLSIVLGFSLPIYTQYLKHQKIKKTEENIEVIMHALSIYVLQNGTLPCPSKPSQDENQQGKPCDYCVLQNFHSGLVPFKVLGLKDSEVKDGWGRWISYTVDLDLILTSLSVQGQFKKTDAFCKVQKTSPVLKILGSEKQPAIIQNSKRFIAFVLISHGPSGGGALLNNCETIPTNNIDKQFNARRGYEYIDQPMSLNFDDKLRWITRDQFISQYAKSTCQHND